MNDLAWINGTWQPIKQLMLPIQDRGLQLGDGIFETIVILKGTPQLLEEHIKRWKKSASLLNMQTPPSLPMIMPLIQEGISHALLQNSNGAIRLNWSRGDRDKRGINTIEKKEEVLNHKFWMELYKANPCFSSISTMISRHEKRNAESRISNLKTFGYMQSIQVRQEAQQAGYDEGIMISTNGEISCGSVGNLLIYRNNQWLTPALTSGCLPGVMRERGLKLGIFEEAHLEPTPLKEDQWLLINSLGCRPINQINHHKLEVFENPEKLWLSLLNREETIKIRSKQLK